MPQLDSIPSLPRDAVDLLEAVGYITARELCESHTQELFDELAKADQALGIMSESPTLEQLLMWKGLAESSIGDGYVSSEDSTDAAVSVVAACEGVIAPEVENIEADDDSIYQGAENASGSVDFEQDSEVQAMLEMSPDAELISAELIKKNDLAVSDIPKGLLLTECEGDVEINVMTPQSRERHRRQAAEAKRSGLMTSRIRSFQDAETGNHHVKPLDKGKPRDMITQSEGLNVGLTPESRRFVRGVLHPDPMSVRISAFFAVLVQVFLVITIIAVPSLIAYDTMFDVPGAMWWILGIIVGLVLAALCYLFWGINARCRVCGQRQFAPKKCLKNKKAHHIPMIGYIFPTALHAMFFKWFYCTYCGTAVRLKK